MMDLPLSGVIGAAVGVVVGLIDYGIIASLIRRLVEKQGRPVDPRRMDLVMKGVLVVNVLVFAALGWWLGVSVVGVGMPPA